MRKRFKPQKASSQVDPVIENPKCSFNEHIKTVLYNTISASRYDSAGAMETIKPYRFLASVDMSAIISSVSLVKTDVGAARSSCPSKSQSIPSNKFSCLELKSTKARRQSCPVLDIYSLRLGGNW
eukprot:scaffold125923_cov59-Attheya_sp.AAC.1